VASTGQPPASQTRYPDGWTVVPAADFRETCFTQLGASGSVSPGVTITAYIGFRGTGRADRITAVDIRQPGVTLLDLERTG